MKTAHIRTEPTSLGRDPEMADIDNPNGDILGFASRVIVEDERGSRWSHSMSFARNTEAEAITAAEKLCAEVNALLECGGELKMQYWREEQPAYGSIAYIAGNCEEEQRQRERDEG